MSRPISPFLTVYKPQITSLFSIAERITGILLVLLIYFGVIMLKLDSLLLTNYWFYSIYYSVIKGSVGGMFVGGLLLFAVLCGVYHIVFGLRYLYWDRVFKKLDLEEINKTTPVLLGVTLVITFIYWIW